MHQERDWGTFIVENQGFEGNVPMASEPRIRSRFDSRIIPPIIVISLVLLACKIDPNTIWGRGYSGNRQTSTEIVYEGVYKDSNGNSHTLSPAGVGGCSPTIIAYHDGTTTLYEFVGYCQKVP